MGGNGTHCVVEGRDLQNGRRCGAAHGGRRIVVVVREEAREVGERNKMPTGLDWELEGAGGCELGYLYKIIW